MFTITVGVTKTRGLDALYAGRRDEKMDGDRTLCHGNQIGKLQAIGRVVSVQRTGDDARDIKYVVVGCLVRV